MTGTLDWRRPVAEGLGTAMLLAAVVGSGIMGERLAGGNIAIALLANSIATGAALTVLIMIFGPVSGAHFNPAVTLVSALERRLGWGEVVAFVAAQIGGGVLGVAAAHAMFDLPLLAVSATERSGTGQIIAEVVATFGLVLTIGATRRNHPAATPYAVGLYIAAAYWFTASTSFANPAVTIARAFTDTFAGITPADVAPFIGAQGIGALAAFFLCRALWPEPRAATSPVSERLPAQSPRGP